MKLKIKILPLVAGVFATSVATMACGQQGNYSGNNDSFNNNYCTAFGNGNTIYCTPPTYRTPFTEALGSQLIQHMPDKTKPVVISTIGNDADQAIGTQVQKYFVAHGYHIQTHNMIQWMVPPPVHPFTLQVEGTQYEVIVAPSAH